MENGETAGRDEWTRIQQERRRWSQWHEDIKEVSQRAALVSRGSRNEGCAGRGISSACSKNVRAIKGNYV